MLRGARHSKGALLLEMQCTQQVCCPVLRVMMTSAQLLCSFFGQIAAAAIDALWANSCVFQSAWVDHGLGIDIPHALTKNFASTAAGSACKALPPTDPP
jgi:hypothetical protein